MVSFEVAVVINIVEEELVVASVGRAVDVMKFGIFDVDSEVNRGIIVINLEVTLAIVLNDIDVGISFGKLVRTDTFDVVELRVIAIGELDNLLVLV